MRDEEHVSVPHTLKMRYSGVLCVWQGALHDIDRDDATSGHSRGETPCAIRSEAMMRHFAQSSQLISLT